MGLLLVPLLTPPGSAVRTLAGGLFTSGICLFSGGLYGTGRWGCVSVCVWFAKEVDGLMDDHCINGLADPRPVIPPHYLQNFQC